MTQTEPQALKSNTIVDLAFSHATELIEFLQLVLLLDHEDNTKKPSLPITKSHSKFSPAAHSKAALNSNTDSSQLRTKSITKRMGLIDTDLSLLDSMSIKKT